MRVIIVANRLPVSIVEKNGHTKLEKSPGGLVSGMTTFLESSDKPIDYVWVGWPGNMTDTKGLNNLDFGKKLHPVFLSKEDAHDFYNGFCNDTIWPLFHSFADFAVYNTNYWQTYKRVNEIFCNAVMEVAKPGDVIWVHDYQLMLLPRMLRERMPDAQIGFFLHIPFPSYEIFRLLPKKWREGILNGILGSNLVGFHTHDYAQYFLRSVGMILGLDHSMGEVETNNHLARVDTFPMGIDFEKFNKAKKSKAVQKEIELFEKNKNGRKIILSIDRLDYTKGILKRLHAYQLFLEQNSDWYDKVTMQLVVVPSRIGVERYQEMKREIDELVGNINGKYGNSQWTPILYQYKSLDFNSLTALYCISDVALVTPLRDGMNLVAKEYVATRTDETGVLILSEMAGSVKELGESLVINPYHSEEICEAIEKALTMDKDEQIDRNRAMRTRIERYNIHRWGNDFLNTLAEIKVIVPNKTKVVNSVVKGLLLKKFRESTKKLIILDYDGTLLSYVSYHFLAKPSPELLTILKRLGNLPKTKLVIISGRDRDTMQKWFANIPLTLIAEHGVWLKENNKEWEMTKRFQNSWKKKALPVLKRFCDRVPNSILEEKDFSIAWHYRQSDPELAAPQIKELVDTLVNLFAGADVEILRGRKVIELRNVGANKGSVVSDYLAKNKFDFILAAGDDTTDEDMFKELPPNSFSLKVGMEKTEAKYNVYNYNEILGILEQILEDASK